MAKLCQCGMALNSSAFRMEFDKILNTRDEELSTLQEEFYKRNEQIHKKCEKDFEKRETEMSKSIDVYDSSVLSVRNKYQEKLAKLYEKAGIVIKDKKNNVLVNSLCCKIALSSQMSPLETHI